MFARMRSVRGIKRNQIKWARGNKEHEEGGNGGEECARFMIVKGVEGT